MIDLNDKYSRITDNGFTVGYALKNFYPFFILWIMNTFSGILTFITVLFFTSQITNNTEVVAINSSGVSFHRFARPYIYVAILIFIISLTINHFLLPWGNIKKNKFEYAIELGDKAKEYNKERTIAVRTSPTDYIFINAYLRENKRGSGFHFQKFDSIKQLKYELLASDMVWSEEDTTYILYNYFEKTVNPNGKDIIKNGPELRQKFKFTPDELLPEGYVAETMNTIELQKFIQREKEKGSGDTNMYYVELYQRTSMPFAILILTILGLSIASEKRRGGIGVNLALGLILACIFVFSFEIMKRFAGSGELSPFIAVTFPNFVFGILTVYFYIRRSRI
jgi:lipopolysaccharide export system permease protein